MNGKLILFLVILAISILALAVDSWGSDWSGNLEVGYVPEIESFETQINLEYTPWKWVTLYAGIDVLMKHYQGLSFMPYRDTYIVGATFFVTPSLYFDLYHHCAHMVWSGDLDLFYENFGQGNKTKISLGIKI